MMFCQGRNIRKKYYCQERIKQKKQGSIINIKSVDFVFIIYDKLVYFKYYFSKHILNNTLNLLYYVDNIQYIKD